MIVLFTDFSVRDPYVGQLKARLAQLAPMQPVIDLLHEVPDFNPHAGAHLLASLASGFPPGSVFLTVVDPGVGTPRNAAVVYAGGCWYVGPDNGLLSIVAARHVDTRLWHIVWRPERVSATFHGRDIFASIAAEIACGDLPVDKLASVSALSVEFDENDLARIIYIDHYGNAWTGIRDISKSSRVVVAGEAIGYGESFGFVGKGERIWYINSVGLLEIAINRGSAAEVVSLKVGDPVQVLRPN